MFFQKPKRIFKSLKTKEMVEQYEQRNKTRLRPDQIDFMERAYEALTNKLTELVK